MDGSEASNNRDYATTLPSGLITRFLRIPSPLVVLEASVDLLLLDLDMPGMNKPDGFFTIRRRFPKLSIAILSGINNSQTIRLLLDGGARGYISKSVPSEELMSALRKILDGEV